MFSLNPFVKKQHLLSDVLITSFRILGWMPQIALFAAAPAPSRGVALASLALMLLQLIALVNSQLSETCEFPSGRISSAIDCYDALADLPPIPSRESVADIDLSKFGINDEQKLFRCVGLVEVRCRAFTHHLGSAHSRSRALTLGQLAQMSSRTPFSVASEGE